MSRRVRYNPKTDANHKLVSEFIEAVGGIYRGHSIDCLDISKIGGRRTDWIVAVDDVNIFIEIKTPEAYAAKDYGLTEGERSFFLSWPGRKEIIESTERLEDLIIQVIDEIESR